VTVPSDTPSDSPAPAQAPAPASPAPASPAPASPAAASEAASTTTPDPTPPSAVPSKPPTPIWPIIGEGVTALYAWLMRPRVRLTLAGGLLLLIGALIANNTMWTLPLVIVGALMVAVAWIGHRLEGRFAVEWGEAGTQLAFRATIKPPQPTTDMPALTRAVDDVIEGDAHTVEINVGELKALIAAAEATEAAEGAAPAERAEAPDAVGAEPAGDAEVRDIRIRRLVDDGAPGPRAAG